MTVVTPTTSLGNVCVPISLVRDASRFGGVVLGDSLVGRLVIRDGFVERLEPQEDIDVRSVVLPRLTECHVHLDKCHTIDRLFDVGGDLQSAIEAQARDRDTWTAEDIRVRARKGLSELAKAGCGAVRSHVDWSASDEVTKAPASWHILNELGQEPSCPVDLQVAPLTNVSDFLDVQTADALAQIIASSGGVLGVYVLDQMDRHLGIENVFRVAEKYGLALDFHVDEGLSAGLDGLEIIADVANAMGFEGPILCGHCCSLMNVDGDALTRLLDKVARAKITIASLPTSNLYLQGRTGGTPDRRGLTRIHELIAAGVNVAIGTDNVRDAFCPVGKHDPVHSLSTAILAAQFNPPFGAYLPMITTNAQKALGLAPTYVDGAAIGDLLLFDATSTSDLLSGALSPRLLSDVMQGEIT